MIFLAVGTQLPFDRLTRAMDAWCKGRGQQQEVYGQVGVLGPDNYKPQHFEWAEKIDPEGFLERVKNADVFVSHAGMGSIITAMTLNKRILIVPRIAQLGEQRNDHQLATADKFEGRSGIVVIRDTDALPSALDRLLQDHNKHIDDSVSPFADERLIEAIRNLIHKS